MEVNINRISKELNIVVKTENEEIAPYFAKYPESCFKELNLL